MNIWCCFENIILFFRKAIPMTLLYILLGIAAFLVLATFLTSYVCFRMTFYSNRKKQQTDPNEIRIPDGEIYEPYREQIVAWTKGIRALPHTDVEIQSFDGLTLRGKFFEHKKGAPIELMFHGYRGTSERDLCGGVYRCFSLGRSALLVDHRGSGNSEGNVITFGVNESRDLARWVDYIIENIDPDAKIILTGVSMGAATVMIGAGMDLPKNVVGVLADCGYTSAKDIIQKVVREMKLPPALLYPFIKLGARLYGHFDLEEFSPIESMKKARVPVIFFHGDGDDFVPHSMSVENYNACVTHKKLVTMRGAGHGLCFPQEQKDYCEALKDFFDPILNQETTAN